MRLFAASIWLKCNHSMVNVQKIELFLLSFVVVDEKETIDVVSICLYDAIETNPDRFFYLDG